MIKIYDINDNELIFLEEIYIVSVFEMFVVGKFMYNIYDGN